MNLNEILFSQHWLLSIIFAILILISIVSWYLIFKKTFFFKSELLSLEKSHKSFSNSLLKQAQEFLATPQKNTEITNKKLHLLLEDFKEKINCGQNFLASIANLTPFIGLFGTVIGVYFALIDIANEGNANIAIVAKPIGEALIATAFGLWCAIPASFAYNYFAKKSATLLNKIKTEIEKRIIEIEEKNNGF